MCMKTPKVEKPKPVQPAPRREEMDLTSTKRKLAGQQGVFSNIFTSALGDSGYGASAAAGPKLATLG